MKHETTEDPKTKRTIDWSVYIERIRAYLAKHQSMSSVNEVAVENEDKSNWRRYQKARDLLILSDFIVLDKEYLPGKRWVLNPDFKYNLDHVPLLADFYFQHKNKLERYVKQKDPNGAMEFCKGKMKRMAEKHPAEYAQVMSMFVDALERNKLAKDFVVRKTSQYTHDSPSYVRARMALLGLLNRPK